MNCGLTNESPPTLPAIVAQVRIRKIGISLHGDPEAKARGKVFPELREAAVKDFEKRFVKPIRDVAGVS